MSWRFIKGLGAAETQRLRGGEERRGEGDKRRQRSSLFVFLSPWILVSLLGFISACATVIGLTQSREDARRPPNFVIIFADDLAYHVFPVSSHNGGIRIGLWMRPMAGSYCAGTARIA